MYFNCLSIPLRRTLACAALVGLSLCFAQEASAYITSRSQGAVPSDNPDGNRSYGHVFAGDNPGDGDDGSMQGDPVYFTWSIVPDATSYYSSSTTTGTERISAIVSYYDSVFSVPVVDQTTDLTNRPWFPGFSEGLEIISKRSGVTYVYEPNDDGADCFLTYSSSVGELDPGVLGVRGDLRIAGSSDLFAGGLSTTATGNLHHPETYIKLQSFNSNSSIRFVIMHEAVHALTFSHSTVNGSSNQSAVTGSGGTSNGPQFDDIAGLHRKYGDFYEKVNAATALLDVGNNPMFDLNGSPLFELDPNGNDILANATDLGSVDIGETVIIGDDADDGTTVALDEFDFISIDGTSDTDFLKFTVSTTGEYTIILDPRGPTYTNYGTDWVPAFRDSNIQTIVADSLNDLEFTLYDSVGAPIQVVSSAGLGQPEVLITNLAAGVYYAKVEGTTADPVQEISNVAQVAGPQFYAFSVGVPIGLFKLSERNSPGNVGWNFASIASPSDTDYADANAGNGVTVSVAAGALLVSNSGPILNINDGAGQLNNDDFANSVRFANGSRYRIQMDLQELIDITEINTYSWHSGVDQNQQYDLYYSETPIAPASGDIIIDLEAEGWVLLTNVDTGYDTGSEGQIAVNIREGGGGTLLQARHLLWDLNDRNNYLGEFDVVGTSTGSIGRIKQTGTHSSGNTLGWLDPGTWSDGMAPVSGVDYVNDIDGRQTRPPQNSQEPSPVFFGKSLTLLNGAEFWTKFSGTATVADLTIGAGGGIGLVSGAALDGNLALSGSGTISLRAGTHNRKLTIHSQVTAEPSIETIEVFVTTGAWTTTAFKNTGFTLTDTNNTFSGLWDVQQGFLKGSGFGTGSFQVHDTGYLDFDADYSNISADLTVLSGGLVLLDQNVTVGSATINGQVLAEGFYTGAELKADGVLGTAFDSSSLDSSFLIVSSTPVSLITQIAANASGESWETGADWSDGNPASSGSDYFNQVNNQVSRTPPSASPVFPGDSLTISNGAILRMKHSGTVTIADLTIGAGSQLDNGGSSGLLDGNISLVGTGAINFDSQIGSRLTTIHSLVTADPSIDTINILMGQVPWGAPASTAGFVMNNASNVFAGTWDIQIGMLKGVGFGTASFNVGALGYLDFDSDFSNAASDLTVISGGQILLDQGITVGSATINGQVLADGVYTGATLKADGTVGSAFDPASSDSSTLTVGTPSSYQTWLSENPSLSDTSFDGDGNGNGIPNGLEYVFGGDAAPSGEIVPEPSATDPNLVFNFDRNADSTSDTTQIFQYTAELTVGWTDLNLTGSVSPEVSIGTAVDGVQPITITIDNSAPAFEEFFWRFKVDLNE